ncbi:MAG: hypothetical protein Q8922_00070 [Bacteroidota bacterium]|nr:hypothetical protein [Bacteroidota bacterium]MDP4232428.1 hypothetical protein [Bacteroidota bacterium]MDP4241564.1 hypothetical protein [Bacteroidota bacterium]MDP4286308.1 hypothetical protein [Bacteroidota bacterium]
MESKVLTSIPGIEYYPIVSLILFFSLFAVLIVWFFRANPRSSRGQRLEAIAQAALSDNDCSSSDFSTSNANQTYA